MIVLKKGWCIKLLDQILQNTADKIEIDIYYNNVLTNPDSIIIREIRNPSGTVILTNQAVTAGSTTGRYYYTVAAAYTATLGVYNAIWKFVIGSSTFEHTQSYEVVSSFRTGYVTPHEVREGTLYSKITDTVPTDAVLQRYIDRATTIMDSYLGDTINYAAYSEERRCVLDKIHNGIHVQLSHKPILTLTSVQLMQEPTNTVDLDVDHVRTNAQSGFIEYFSDISTPTLRICTFNPSATQIIPVATVVYTAGYTTVPQTVKDAAIILIEELYKQTNGDDKTLVRFQIGENMEQYGTFKSEEDAMEKLGISNSRAIIKLLVPFRQPYKRFIFAGPL